MEGYDMHTVQNFAYFPFISMIFHRKNRLWFLKRILANMKVPKNKSRLKTSRSDRCWLWHSALNNSITFLLWRSEKLQWPRKIGMLSADSEPQLTRCPSPNIYVRSHKKQRIDVHERTHFQYLTVQKLWTLCWAS